MLLILSWLAMTGMFSSSFYAFSYVAKFDMPVDFMMFYRMMIACLVIFFIIRLKKQRFLIKKSEVLLSVLVSVSQLNVYLSGYATKYIISGLVPCILLAQIFVAEFLVSIYEKRRMHGNIILSGIIGLIGVFMLCNQQLKGIEKADTIKTLMGIGLAFLSTFASALGNLIYEKGGKPIREMPRTTFLFYNCFFAGIAFLVIGLIFRPTNMLFNGDILMNGKYMSTLCYLAFGPTTIALFAMYYIIEKQGAVKTTYVNFILPIVAMMISTMLEGFRWNTMAVVGMLLLMGSVWIGIRPNKTKNNKIPFGKLVLVRKLQKEQNH